MLQYSLTKKLLVLVVEELTYGIQRRIYIGVQKMNGLLLEKIIKDIQATDILKILLLQFKWG